MGLDMNGTGVDGGCVGSREARLASGRRVAAVVRGLALSTPRVRGENDFECDASCCATASGMDRLRHGSGSCGSRVTLALSACELGCSDGVMQSGMLTAVVTVA